MPTRQTDEVEFPIGTSLQYKCRPGYQRRVFSITCLRNSVWSSPESCTRKSCETPSEPINGKMEITGEAKFGSVIKYSCNEGNKSWGWWIEREIVFIIQFPGYQYCIIILIETLLEPNALFLFLEIFCTNPPAILNGNHTGTSLRVIPYGTEISYTCNSHPDRGMTFKLIGERTIRCTSDRQGNGLWSGPAPRCELSGSPGQYTFPHLPYGSVCLGKNLHIAIMTVVFL
ncbi:hypothetical protein QTO34_011546 [Cnephaeus nilssonii]|uniref:Sushi domain-containing protein n=1 Tax=Cnephaeus nilssonii TaxID=3371016 RepID=A0AA40HDQ2_CNENI|nr:hypothetical protein QTO34_011546 [Eptesicus nilssonii]